MALFTVTVKVDAPPPTTSDVVVVVTSIVEPEIRMGICVDFPLAVAVIVAVRLLGFEVPDEKVAAALPDESLTAEPVERKPVSAEKAIATPDKAAFEESTTVAVIVVLLLLSAATVVDEALRLIDAAVGAGVSGVVGGVGAVVPELPPPQALNRLDASNTTKSQANLDEFLFTCTPTTS